MIPRAIKGKRADSLESLTVNRVLVVVLNAEILPLDHACTALDNQADCTAPEIATFRTDTHACAILSEVGRHLATKALDHSKLRFEREPAQWRDKIRIEPRAQRNAIDDEVQV